MSLSHVRTTITEEFTYNGDKVRRLSYKGRPFGYRDSYWYRFSETTDYKKGILSGFYRIGDAELVDELERMYQQLK